MSNSFGPIVHGPEVEELLAQADLPPTDPADIGRVQFFARWSQASLIGVIGVEAYGSVALLRSLAVATGRRGLGNGRQLVRQAEAWAAAQGVQQLYLLTTTATEFFIWLGYVILPRHQAPRVIRQTRQFDEVCPAAAVLLTRDLRVSRLPNER